ncbi:hypothetical protein [Streptomyces xanthophaeus]|uniref:hypothetical protein n=1 Tax=Streptomyces xanthophaeus TaxID=67385 RepID=UPI003722D00D
MTYTITKDDLRSGDALNNDNLGSSGHIVLFDRWTSTARSSYWGYEFSGSGVHYRQIPYPYFAGSNPSAYKPVRNRYVVDDAPSVPVPVNGDLYALTPDKSSVVVRNGSSWTAVGGAASALYAGGAGLFAIYPGDGGIYRYNGTPNSWTRVGGAGAAFAVSDRHLFALTTDRSAVMQWTGSGVGWEQIGGAATALYAGAAGLFATNPGDGGIHRYNGTPNSWARVGNSGAAFAVNDNALYGLTPNRSAVMRWTGSGDRWEQVGGPAESLYAGGTTMVATSPNGGDVFRFNGTPHSWTQIGGPGASFALSRTHIYGPHSEPLRGHRVDGFRMERHWRRRRPDRSWPLTGTTPALAGPGPQIGIRAPFDVTSSGTRCIGGHLRTIRRHGRPRSSPHPFVVSSRLQTDRVRFMSSAMPQRLRSGTPRGVSSPRGKSEASAGPDCLILRGIVSEERARELAAAFRAALYGDVAPLVRAVQ